MKKMKWIPIAVLTGAVALAAPDAPAKEKIYTWIDENGVIYYTNTRPPEGATIIDSKKEIPFDEQKARQRRQQQEQYLQQLRQERQASEQQDPAPAASEKAAPRKTTVGQNENPEAVESDRGSSETYHQRQIEKRQREKLREQTFGE